MDTMSYSSFGPISTSTVDDRDLPQLSNVRIAPLRNPIAVNPLRVPSPLEPDAGGIDNLGTKAAAAVNGSFPIEHPTLEDYFAVARTTTPVSALTMTETPPRTILPTFINPRTVENLPPPPFDTEHTRKLSRIDGLDGHESFGEHLQLPIPKTQKGTLKPPTFGPFTILNGLNEPPPNAALFPPIEPTANRTILSRPRRESTEQASWCPNEEKRGRWIDEIIDSSFENAHRSQPIHEEESRANHTHLIKVRQSEQTKPSDTTEESQKEGTFATKGLEKKKLCRWTEQETRNLLKGVARCGVGNWKKILDQPDLKFNKRTAANLKDRFRVCCSWAYDNRNSDPQNRTRIVNNKPLSNILNPTTETIAHQSKEVAKLCESEILTPTNIDTKRVPTFKSSTALNDRTKKTLLSFGASEPNIKLKTKRRARRPFIAAEDEALLRGYVTHGFQWSLIQQDKNLNLMHRRATDLRDRFRTKFPQVYRESGSVSLFPHGTHFSKEREAIQDSNSRVPVSMGVKTDGTTTSLPPLTRSHVNYSRTASCTLSPFLTVASQQPPYLRNMMPKSPGSTFHGVRRSSASVTVPVDSTTHTLAPPSALPEFSLSFGSSVFPFTMDDNGLDWNDNTLPPLAWDDDQ